MVLFRLLASPGLLLRDSCINKVFDIFFVFISVLFCAAWTLYIRFVNLYRFSFLWHLQILDFIISGWPSLTVMNFCLVPNSCIVHRIYNRSSLGTLRCLRFYNFSNSNFQSLIFCLFSRLRFLLFVLSRYFRFQYRLSCLNILFSGILLFCWSLHLLSIRLIVLDGRFLDDIVRRFTSDTGPSHFIQF